MAFLSKQEKQTLVDQINQAEAKTSAEIVTVIAKQSDGYRYIPLMWAAIAALSVPGWVFLYQTIFHNGWAVGNELFFSSARIYQLQILLFFGLCMLFQIPSLRLMLIPKSVKNHRARRHAHEQFFVQNLHLTKNANGVLIFVSQAEHYVEIIVDKGIADVINNEEWQLAVNEFVALIKQGEIAKGFGNTVEHCREILWQHFPAENGRPDELPNHLIEI